jgi:hypothetical protein
MRLTISQLAGALSLIPTLLAAQAPAARHETDVITAAQLARSGQENVYQAILHIRPDLLRNRPSGSLMLFSASHPAVAVNNEIVGGVEVLRSIPISRVSQIQYVDSWNAANRYDLSLKDGVVLVTEDSAKAEVAVAR